MGTGEKIGERAYGVYTYDYSIRTFCSFLNDRFFKKNTEITSLTETIDILPTLLDKLGIIPDNLSPLKKILSGNKSACIIPPGIFLGQFFSIPFKFFSITCGKSG